MQQLGTVDLKIVNRYIAYNKIQPLHKIPLFQALSRDYTNKTQSTNAWDNQKSLHSKLQDFDLSLFNK